MARTEREVKLKKQIARIRDEYDRSRELLVQEIERLQSQVECAEAQQDTVLADLPTLLDRLMQPPSDREVELEAQNIILERELAEALRQQQELARMLNDLTGQGGV